MAPGGTGGYMSNMTKLDSLIEQARNHKMTPAERRTQRVSMIMGLRGRSSTLTRDKVEDVLDEVEGREAHA
jgi:hypothetical protein